MEIEMEKRSDADIARRRDEALRRALNMAPKSHDEMKIKPLKTKSQKSKRRRKTKTGD
jgi:hypothetical protein